LTSRKLHPKMTSSAASAVVVVEVDLDVDAAEDVEDTMTGVMAAAVTEAMEVMDLATITIRAMAAMITIKAMADTIIIRDMVDMTTLATVAMEIKAMEITEVVANKSVMARARQAGAGGQGVHITLTAVNHE